MNRGLLRNNSDKTPYDLWKGIPSTMKHFKVFRIKFYIKWYDDDLGKFESRNEEGIFLG